MNRKQVLTQTQQQSQNQQTKQAVAQSQIEFAHLYDHPPIPPVPWKFVVEWEDYFWPVKWMLYPLGGDFWLMKKESPWNEYAREKSEIIGIFIDGELVFAEPEWNNQVLQIRKKEDILSLFEEVRRGKFSGVALEENLSEEEKEEAEKLLRWSWVVKQLIEDRERISEYGKITFGRYIERYYSRWLEEFRDFFEKLAEMEGKERIKYLKNVKRELNQRLFATGFFMYIYYP